MGHAADGSDQGGRRREASQAAVIVGLDGRKHDADALALARSLSTVLGGHLVLAHVVPPPPLGSLAALAPMEQVASGRTFLTHAAAKLARGSTTELVDSVPAAVGLADLAIRYDASMLVLGSSHRGPVGRIVPGSTASRLLGRSPCAVAVAPMGYASAEPTSISVIGIAYDGTSESEAALEAAAAMAAKLSVPLHLYHAVQQGPDGSGSNPTPRHTYELARSTIEAGSRRIPRDVDVTPSVLEGDTATVLIDVGAHFGRSGNREGVVHAGSVQGVLRARSAAASNSAGGMSLPRWLAHNRPRSRLGGRTA